MDAVLLSLLYGVGVTTAYRALPDRPQGAMWPLFAGPFWVHGALWRNHGKKWGVAALWAVIGCGGGSAQQWAPRSNWSETCAALSGVALVLQLLAFFAFLIQYHRTPPLPALPGGSYRLDGKEGHLVWQTASPSPLSREEAGEINQHLRALAGKVEKLKQAHLVAGLAQVEAEKESGRLSVALGERDRQLEALQAEKKTMRSKSRGERGEDFHRLNPEQLRGARELRLNEIRLLDTLLKARKEDAGKPEGPELFPVS